MLLENSNITLTEAVLLDQVQKGILPKDDAVNMLRKNILLKGVSLICMSQSDWRKVRGRRWSIQSTRDWR